MSQNYPDYTEKRDFIRIRVDTDVTLIQANQVIGATCRDLSGSGMQVEAPRSFQVGEQLRVRIDSEHATLKGLEAQTQVVWVADQEQGTQKLGLKIVSTY